MEQFRLLPFEYRDYLIILPSRALLSYFPSFSKYLLGTKYMPCLIARDTKARKTAAVVKELRV